MDGLRRQRLSALPFALALAGMLAAAPAPSRGNEPGRSLEAVAVWQQRLPGGDWDVFFALLGRPAGGPLAWWTPDGAAPAAPVAVLAGDDENPAVAVRPGDPGSVVAVWQHRDPGGATDIWGSSLHDGQWTPPAPLATTTGDDFDPAVALDAGGGGLALWVNGSGDAARVVTSRFDGVSWGAAETLAAASSPSLPEVAFLDGAPNAIAVFSAVVGDLHRTHYAVWDGAAWSEAAPVPLEPAQVSALPDHGFADYAEPLAAFDRIGVAPEAGGGAIVVWGGARWEPNRWSTTAVEGARRDASGAWEALRWDDGTTAGEISCPSRHTPALAMTAGRDFMTMFGSHEGFEAARGVSGVRPAVDHAFDSSRNDHRPALAPLVDRVVAVSWGEPYADDPEWPNGRIQWSLGTPRAAADRVAPTVTWSAPAEIAVPGEGRYPAVASVLGGTSNPLAVHSVGRAAAAERTIGGDTATQTDTGAVEDASASVAVWSAQPDPLVSLAGVESVVMRGDDRVTATVRAARVTIHIIPLVQIEELSVVARADCSFGPSAGTAFASIEIGGVRVALDSRTNTAFSVGALTLRLNEQTITASGATVRGVHLTGPGVDVTVGLASAVTTGCVGSGGTVFTDPGHGGH